MVALPLLTITAACAPVRQPGAPEPVVVERLYFGRTLADTVIVTDSAWTAFVTEVVTPRFPAGLTVYAAAGQWRAPDGRVQREPSFVLELVLPARTRDTDAAIAAIVAEYKRRFRQESVLRVVMPAHAGHD
ncbi:MAG: DUF3574 domain-containing protein [Candidatus Methylomirabilaceae bacterium]